MPLEPECTLTYTYRKFTENKLNIKLSVMKTRVIIIVNNSHDVFNFQILKTFLSF